VIGTFQPLSPPQHGPRAPHAPPLAPQTLRVQKNTVKESLYPAPGLWERKQVNNGSSSDDDSPKDSKRKRGLGVKSQTRPKCLGSNPSSSTSELCILGKIYLTSLCLGFPFCTRRKVIVPLSKAF
jgi:hypothetical protein